MATIHSTATANNNYAVSQNTAGNNNGNKAKACGKTACAATCPLFKGCRKATAPNNNGLV